MRVRKAVYLFFAISLLLVACAPGNDARPKDAESSFSSKGGVVKVVTDSLNIANPFVVYDEECDKYYIVGDGGNLWRSDDLNNWEGPFEVSLSSEQAWLGAPARATSPEIHKHDGRFYYIATFTLQSPEGEEYNSCELFVSDSIAGPYTHLTRGAPLLLNNKEAVHPAFYVDDYNVAYVVYSGDTKNKRAGAVQVMRLGDDYDVQVGEPYNMYGTKKATATDTMPAIYDNSEMYEPFLFETDQGRFGMLFTARSGGEKVLGVAYTPKGLWIEGPWEVEPQPLLRGNAGGVMIFKDYDGTSVLVFHKDTVVNGTKRCIPQFIKTDKQFEKLKLKGHYKF